MPAAALVTLVTFAALACDDGGLEPEDVIGTYELTSYLGQPLPAVLRVGGLQPPREPFSTPPGCETLLESGTLELIRGGSYTQVWTERTTCPTAPEWAADVRVDGTWRIEADRLRLIQPVEGGEPAEWVAYLHGDRLEVEVVIQRFTEDFPESGPTTPADTSFIIYRRS
ncbi:MAG TPA: hypothetical protein VIL18_13855 [Longimicrobiales bacterium]